MPPAKKPSFLAIFRPSPRLQKAFLSTEAYGAEWDGERLYICRIRQSGKGFKVLDTFSGTLEEAAAFAKTHDLKWEGLHLGYQDPFVRILPLGRGEEGDEDLLALAEKSLPQGLKSAEVEQRLFSHGDETLAATMRSQALQGLLEALPEELSSLLSLCPSPLCLIPWIKFDGLPDRFAALYFGPFETHALFFRDGLLCAWDRLAIGQKDQGTSSVTFIQEAKRSLIYSWEATHPELPLQGYQIWNDSPDSRLASELSLFPLLRLETDFSRLPKTDFQFLPALAMAASALASAPFCDFGPSHDEKPKKREALLRSAGKISSFGLAFTVWMLSLLCLLFLGSFGLNALIRHREKKHANELSTWKHLQQIRSQVEQKGARFGAFLEQKNDASGTLGSVAALLPEETWLEDWELREGDGQKFHQVISGFALSENRVPEFVSRLEGSHLFSSVRLRSTEKIPAAKVEGKTGIKSNHRDLVRFEIVAEE